MTVPANITIHRRETSVHLRPLSFVAFLAFLFTTFAARSQNDVVLGDPERLAVTEDKDSVRRYYIRGFPDYFFLYPVLKQRSLNFELSRPSRDALLTYKPNNTFSMGLGMYVFELGIEVAFAIPLREKSIERFGESEARDLQLNVLTKRWGIDAFSQHYSGFYVVDHENKQSFPKRPDIVTRNFGLTGHYVFNHQKFSFRSAYNYSERQLLSRGSFILLGALNTFRVASDSSIVQDSRRPDFGSHVDFVRLRYTTLSLAPGYTYNLTYNNFFLNMTLAVGPAHHWINYDLETGPLTKYDIAINTFFGGRMAIGYNGYRLFGGLSYILQGSTLRFEDVRFSNNNSMFKMLVGYRFNEVGVLKRRVWDWLPWRIE